MGFSFVSTHGLCLCQVRSFLPYQPMDRLLKKEAAKKAKKEKVEKP
jgi:hypothetical protein